MCGGGRRGGGGGGSGAAGDQTDRTPPYTGKGMSEMEWCLKRADYTGRLNACCISRNDASSGAAYKG